MSISLAVPASPATSLSLAAQMETAVAQDPPETDYPLGVADKVRIIVFDEPSLSGEFTVNANGALSLPLIGDVRAVGQTATEVATVIRRHLMDGYVLQPRVSIDILTFRPFYILGEVNKPGEYPYSSGLTIDGAVATAQGYTYRADKRKVFIKHAGAAQSVKARIAPDLKVRPGDTIRVGERYL
ncbi:polysaccharide export outer membrane protein [Sphingomonas sp. PvP055]|uniref:polysaccharide biosynthesis/export family protein n=1 Tax=Sphingomonas sp. PvP055 TaxID=3156391 RepID=UPI003399DC16